MQTKKLALLIACLLSAAMLWGCGSSGSGGTDVQTIDPADVQTVGVFNCTTCHAGGPQLAKWLASPHAAGNYGGSTGACLACHDPDGDGVELPIAFGLDQRNVVGCEACHGGGSAHRGMGPLPFPAPGAAQCAQCHSLLSPRLAGHLQNNPFSNEISERFADGRHTGRARTGDCAACHSHEGGVLLLSQATKINTVGQIEDLEGDLAALGGNLNPKTCTTCHDPHSGALRGVGDLIQTVALNTDVEAQKVVYSAEFNLCTSCHQVNLAANWNEDLGYAHASSGTKPGAFEYSLSNAYLHANDPYGDNSNIGYHSDSYQDRSFFETHFSGSISKDIYYYDIKNGVEAASSDRFGNPIPEVVNNPEAMAFLEAYYQEYLAAPDDVVVQGYNVNPASPNACSACHDVHSANKIVGTEDLIKPAGHVLNAEPRIQTAIAFGEGIGQTHGNYMSEPFLRAANAAGDLYASANCTPCHNGRDFVKMTNGATRASLGSPVWNTVSCVSCHDLASGADGDVTNPRNFPDAYVYEFNSAVSTDTLVAADELVRLRNDITYDNRTCFECHKGRDGLKEGFATTAQVYNVNYLHYKAQFPVYFGMVDVMIPGYEGKEYTTGQSIALGSTDHSHLTRPDRGTCVGCHSFHEAYDENINPGFVPSLTTNLNCGACHDDAAFDPADPENTARSRSFVTLQARTKVFAEVLREAMLDVLATHVGTNNDAAIIIQGVNGDDVTLDADDLADFTTLLGSAATGVDLDSQKARLKAFITGSTRDVTGSRLVTNELAIAGAIWKNFMYDDKAGWAHNSILARELMYDAIEDLNPARLADLVTKAAEFNVPVNDGTDRGELMRGLDQALRPLPAP